ncbi:ArnT family glycosyltransferase [Mumia sp. Pv 4-285]|uniref:ArnT family glycosyltransferase n=1 Tax=Mumia qirimensis TaxID=3234852 RepID=UPI00351CCD5E
MNTLAADTTRAVRGWVPADMTRAQMVTAAALSLIAAQLALRAWVTQGSWFFEDDFQFLSDIALGRDDLDWYLRPHNVHFMPLSFVLVKIVTLGGPFAWWLAVVETLLLQLAASVSCWWMLRKLFGDRPAILAPLTVYLFSIFSVPTLTWYAAMINQLPLHTCIFLGVLAHVTYLRTRHYRWALVAALVTAVGLLFYVKAIALLMVFGLLALLYFGRGPFVRRFLGVVRRYLWGWLTYAALGAAYLVMYWIHMPREPAEGGTDYLGLARSMLFDTLGTGLTGLSWSWDLLNGGPRSVTDPSTFLVAVSWVVVTAVWFYLYATRVRVLRSLVLLVPYLLLGYGIIAVGRSSSFGAVSGNEARYLSDTSAILALVLALATMHLKGAWESSARRPEPLLTVRLSHRSIVAGLVVYVAASTFSTVMYARPWHDGNVTKDYGLRAIESIEDAERPELADVPVPDDVMWNANAPYNLTSVFFAPLGDRFTTPAVSNDLQVLDDDGDVTQAVVVPGMTSVPGTVAGCGHLVQELPETVALQAETFDFPFWMTIGYLAGSDGEMAVSAGDVSETVPVRAGLHTLFLRTEGAFDTVRLRATDGATICVDQITVGTLEATG